MKQIIIVFFILILILACAIIFVATYPLAWINQHLVIVELKLFDSLIDQYKNHGTNKH